MTIKTISDLPEIDAGAQNLDSSYFEISENCQDNKYRSRKITYKTLSEKFAAAVKTDIAKKGQLSACADIVQLSSDLTDVRSMIDGTSDTPAVFASSPVSNGECRADNQIPNKGQVRDMVFVNSSYVGQDSFVYPNFRNDQGQTALPTVNTQSFYQWHIDSGKKDSSEYFDDVTGRQAGPVTIHESGWLTVYGWLASNSVVQAQEAWVGLFAEVANQSNERQWIALQIQPWVIGSNAQVIQYVGFNAPAKKGLRLKIMTGFPVNGTVSGVQRGNTLLFKSEGNVINTFVGYVTVNGGE